jgi:ribonuclease HI
MRLTINTDASVREGHAGYAFWIVCDAGKIQKAGMIKRLVNGSTDAEIMCIANALHTLKHSRFKGLTSIIINTDSTQSISFITNKTRPSVNSDIYKGVQECNFLMMELCQQNGFSIRETDKLFSMRHVKAHSKNKDSRSYVNDWCDKESKKYSKQRLNKSIK